MLALAVEVEIEGEAVGKDRGAHSFFHLSPVGRGRRTKSAYTRLRRARARRVRGLARSIDRRPLTPTLSPKGRGSAVRLWLLIPTNSLLPHEPRCAPRWRAQTRRSLAVLHHGGMNRRRDGVLPLGC